VNLRTGAVKDLGGGYSIAYFNPGCGIGGTAVLTEGGWADDTSSAPAETTLAVVNTAAGKITSTVRMAGQVTSAVPYQGQIVAAAGKGLEEISDTGATRLLAATATVPYELAPDASGGIGYQTVAGKQVDLWHLASGKTHQVASIAEGSAELRQSDGRVWLVGSDASKVRGLPAQWQPVDAPATAQLSTTATLAVTNTGPLTAKNIDPTAAAPAGINAQLLSGSRQKTSFEISTSPAPPSPSAATSGPAAHAGTSSRATAATAGSPTTPVSADRTCAIAINDPNIQAYQPTFQQVEWAADQAAEGTLTDTRPAGLYGSSLPSYTPQGLFPRPGPLNNSGFGNTLPPQVLLGVLTQESNLDQASTHVVQGQTSNPLTSFNWYGNWIDGDSVNTGETNWTNSDCGYGIGQITSGMCLAQGTNGNPQCEYTTPMSAEDQLAVAVDYQANIAAATQKLIQARDQLENDGIDLSIQYDPTYASGLLQSDFVDDWYMALWDYNSGIEPGTSALGNTTGCTPSPSCTDGNGDWGLGYADNPINPAYPPDRPTFGTASQSNYPAPNGATYSNSWDLAHPQYWPYQDKVLGFAFDSVALYDYSQAKYVQAYAFAHGNYTSPPPDLWCTTTNHCNASGINETLATGPDACELSGTYADHCWWNGATANWFIQSPNSTCSNCGLGAQTYAAGASEPTAEPIASQFAQTCSDAPMPSNAVIVGDGGKSALGCPGQDWTSQGSFTWNFAPDANGKYSSKIDFDQIGAGLGGHYWFGYTVSNDGSSVSSTNAVSSEAYRVITGTWTPPSSVTGWTDIEVAIPGYGAKATAADYQIVPGAGALGRNVQVDQYLTPGHNIWIDLGDFDLSAGAHVSLSNVVNALSSIGVNVAWSAMAFIPISAPSVSYVAMGDSYSSGEGVGSYLAGSDTSTDTCHRSSLAYPELVTLPGQTAPISEQAGDTFDFIACSGAETTGVANAAINPVASPNPVYPTSEQIYNTNGNTDWGYEQYETPWQNSGGPVEGMQASNPVLDSSTTLVTISVGGNDSRFSDVIQGCIMGALSLFGVGKTDCSASDWYLKRASSSATDPQPLYQFEPTAIQLLEQHLLQTYLAINTQAPNADIVVVGYPQLFPENPTASCSSDSYLGKAAPLSVGTQQMLNGFAEDLNSALSTAVTAAQVNGVAIHFVNPTQAFLGHALCDSGTSWIQPLQIVTNKPGSYHPNQQGQAEYGTLVNQ
jgi:hypothetical protein